MNLPDWAEPVLDYMLRVGLKGDTSRSRRSRLRGAS